MFHKASRVLHVSKSVTLESAFGNLDKAVQVFCLAIQVFHVEPAGFGAIPAELVKCLLPLLSLSGEAVAVEAGVDCLHGCRDILDDLSCDFLPSSLTLFQRLFRLEVEDRCLNVAAEIRDYEFW